MGTWIKWWKSNFAWTIIGLVAIAMLLSILSASFLAHPWGLIGTFIICLPIGIVIRKLIIKKIDNIVDKL